MPMNKRLNARSLATFVCVVIAATAEPAVAAPEPGAEAHVRTRAQRYEPLLAAAAARHRIDPRVLWVIGYLETRFRPTLVSPAGASGLMQLMPATARRFGVTDRFDPAQSIEGAAKYVRFLSARYRGRLDLILAGYNAGETAVDAFRLGRRLTVGGRVINPNGIRTGGVPPYAETRAYVAAGLRLYATGDGADLFRAGRFPLATSQHQVLKGTEGDGKVPEALATLSRSIFFDGASPQGAIRTARATVAVEVTERGGSASSSTARPPAASRSLRFW
jgi:hypothetical protein